MAVEQTVLEVALVVAAVAAVRAEIMAMVGATPLAVGEVDSPEEPQVGPDSQAVMVLAVMA